MEFKDFVKKCKDRENKNYDGMRARLSDNTLSLLHGTMLMTGEVGEFSEAVKKHIFYEGRDLDKANLLEELGDALFGMAIVCEALGFDLDQIMKANDEKLAKRHGKKYSKEGEINRNISEEKKILEDNL